MVENIDKIIVLGKGFLGRKFKSKGFNVWGKETLMLFSTTDLSVLDKYDVIINCVAKSNTRWCEDKSNFVEALWVNGLLPGMLSDYCKHHGKKFVHISTGCLYDDGVFHAGWTEDDEITVHLNYTVSKWVGEKRCNEDDLILRPRLLFGDAVDKNNLLCKLPLFTHFVTKRNSLTSTDVLVDAVISLLKYDKSGIYNVACEGNAPISDIAKWVGLKGKTITGKQLRRREGIHLVNNTMDISKLKPFYKPPALKDEIMRCWRAML